MKAAGLNVDAEGPSQVELCLSHPQVKMIELKLPNGIVFDMTGAQFVRDWALAQFYFHATTAYAILRHKGVPLGKPDWVSHMFAYIRPGTLPGG